MILIFFFYGLAFIIMGIVIFFIPKRDDFFDVAKDFWLLSLFGFIHGINEWVDLFILRGKPFDVGVLKTIGSLLLPVSFIFLVIFGARVVSRKNPRLAGFKFLWVVSLSAWIAAYVLSRDLLFCGIFARYFIGLPGGILSSLAMLQIFLKCDRAKLPKIVSVSTVLIIIVFFTYAILTGFIVPEASFFPASVINYTNFKGVIGLPVQFFRMLCAIALAICFFAVAGIFYYKQGKVMLIGGIRRKTLLFVCSASIITAVLGGSMVYLWGYDLLFGTIVKERHHAAQALAYSIGSMLEGQIEQIETYFSLGSFWNQILMEENAKYALAQDKGTLGYFTRMDEQWARAGEDSSLVRGYVDSEAGKRLKKILSKNENIAEIFLTDKFGGLVAASGKITDFYQADEVWWQESFDSGRGNMFIGGIEFDTSSQSASTALAIPIKGPDGEIIGICKIVVSLEFFLAPISNVFSPKKEHVVLVDAASRVIFHKVNGHDVGLCSRGDFDELLNTQRQKRFKAYDFSETGMVVVASAPVAQDKLVRSGLSWMICIEADKNEIFFPLYLLALEIAALSIVGVLVLIIFGLFVSRLFTKPLLKMEDAAKKFAMGDFNYHLEIKTGDELEEVAIVFNQMASELVDSMKIMQAHSERLAVSVIDLEKTNKELKIKKRESEEANEKLLSFKKELEDKILKLEQFNKIAVDREIKMRQLKEKIKDLEEKSGSG